MPKRTSKWNGLQRNKRPKRISDKKRAKLSEELAVKRIVYRRAGGHPFDSAGQNGVVTNVLCEGGNCEICKEKPTPPTYKLSPHEILFRSAGGVPSEDITFATDDLCHWIFQHHHSCCNSVSKQPWSFFAVRKQIEINNFQPILISF